MYKSSDGRIVVIQDSGKMPSITSITPRSQEAGQWVSGSIREQTCLFLSGRSTRPWRGNAFNQTSPTLRLNYVSNIASLSLSLSPPSFSCCSSALENATSLMIYLLEYSVISREQSSKQIIPTMQCIVIPTCKFQEILSPPHQTVHWLFIPFPHPASG